MRTARAEGGDGEGTSIALDASRYFRDNDHDALFRLAIANWPPVGMPMPDGMAEVCRLVSVRARYLGQHGDHVLWRARALSAAVLTGATNTAAGMLLAPFFVALEGAREESNVGAAYEESRLILEEIRRLVREDDPEWKRLYRRIYHEKRAVSFLLQATDGGAPLPGGGRWLEHAGHELEIALQGTTDERDRLKLLGGRALVGYLLQSARSGAEVASELRRHLLRTTWIQKRAGQAGFEDVEGWAATNVQVMERGAFTGWTPYEVV